MKQQAIQLQFDFTDNVQPALTDRLEIAAARAISRALPMIRLFACATLCVAFAFAIIFIAAIIQG